MDSTRGQLTQNFILRCALTTPALFWFIPVFPLGNHTSYYMYKSWGGGGANIV